MPALRDPRLEVFARELAVQLLNGVGRSDAARLAGEAAGYPKGKGASAEKTFAANCRKRSQRKDVKARLAELQQPALDQAQETISATAEWATGKLATIANYELGKEAVKVPDQIAAIKLLAQMHGWLAPEKREHDVSDELGALLREIDGRTRGLPAGA